MFKVKKLTYIASVVSYAIVCVKAVNPRARVSVVTRADYVTVSAGAIAGQVAASV